MKGIKTFLNLTSRPIKMWWYIAWSIVVLLAGIMIGIVSNIR